MRSHALRQSVAMLSLVALIGAAAPACKKKDAKPVPGAGEILLAVVERPTASSADNTFKDVGGVAKATYRFDGQGSQTEQNETRAFTGTLKVPARVQAAQYTLSLSALDVANGAGSRLVRFGDADVRQLLLASKNGVVVTIVTTKDGSKAPETRMSANPTPPPGSQPDTEFRSIKTVFANPQDVLAAADVAATLAKLREIATATREYHDELLDIAKKAESLDLAHLNLLVDACYFTKAQYEELQKRYADLQDRNDAASIAERERVAKNMQLASQLAGYASAIVDEAMAKTTDLTLENAMATFGKLFANGGAERAFAHVIAKFSPLAAEQKLALLAMAKGTGNQRAAVTLAIDWFKNDSDKSAATLLDLSKDYYANSNLDRLLSQASEVQGAVTAQQIRDLVSRASTGETAVAIAQALFPKVQNLTGAQVASVADALYANASRDAVVAAGVASVRQVSSAEARTLLGGASTGNAARALAAQLFPKTTDLTGATLVAIVGALYANDNRDAILINGIDTLATCSAADAAAVINSFATSAQLVPGADKLFRKVPGLTAAQITSATSGLYANSTRDAVVMNALALVRSVSPAEAKQLFNNASSADALKALARAVLPKAGLNGSQLAASVSDLYANSTRDFMLSTGASLVSSWSVADAKAVITAYSASDAMVEASGSILPKTQGLTAANLVDLVSPLYANSSRDAILVQGARAMAAVDANQVKQVFESMSTGANLRTMAQIILPKASGLTGALLARSVSGLYANSDRDFALNAGIAVVPAFSAADANPVLESYSTGEQLVAASAAIAAKLSSLSGTQLGGMLQNVYANASRDAAMANLAAKVPALTTEELRLTVRSMSSSASAKSIALALLPRVSNLSGAGLATAMSDVYANADRDAVLVAGAARLAQASPSAADAKSLVSNVASTGTAKAIVDLLFPRIAGLTVPQVIDVVSPLYANTARDALLLTGLRVVASMTSSEMIALVNQVSAANDVVLAVGIDKISDLTVANAIRIGAVFYAGSTRDAFLLNAVLKVTDLTASNLLTLGDQASSSAKREEIVRKGVERLASGSH